MKKIKLLFISLISIFAFNINAFAASGSFSVSSESVYVGDSFTVTASISSAAAWNVHVSASGPVSGCTINQADATADAMDTNKTFSATCKATGEGTITVRLSGDVTSASDGNAVNISGIRNINVFQKPTPPENNNNSNNNTPSNNVPSNNNNNRSNTSSKNNYSDNRSKNNNIKEISVDGYELIKVDENNYTLVVSNDVESIKINATAEDSKAQVTGAGNHDINIGENNIEVIVTAEDGSQNKINIKVTRKDGYYLEDLDSVLNNDKIDDKNVIIKSDTTITSEELEKIKKSKKLVKFNYYNDDKNIIYSWTIDGSKLKDTNDLLTTITNDSENKKEILVLSNYADGLFVNLKQENNYPTGSKIKMFVGNKYEDNNLVNIYVYIKSDDKIELVKNKVKVDNGYIEFDVADASDYFITMSTIPSIEKVVTTTGGSSSIIMPIIISLICLLFIGIIIVFVIKNKRNKKDFISNNDSKNVNNVENSN